MHAQLEPRDGRRAPAAEAVAELVARPPDHAELIEAWVDRWQDMLGPEIAGTAEVVAELHRRGARLLALTNWSAETFPVARERFASFGYFEAIVVSGEHGIAKPDPAIFRLLFDLHGVDAAAAAYVDDRAANVDAASALGFTGLVFTDPDTLRADLVALGLLGETAASRRAAAGRMEASAVLTGEGAMAIQPIRLFGDPCCARPAEPVVDFDKELRAGQGPHRDDARRSRRRAGRPADRGRPAGVHLPRRRRARPPDQPDPRPLRRGAGRRRGLPVLPGLAFPTKRAFGVVAKGWNMHGEPVTIEGTELLARCIQHETDHLDGILFIDRLDREARKAALKEIREAEWFGDSFQVKVSPHATYGTAL